MFESQKFSRIFALPVGIDFSLVFVEGLLARLQSEPPEALARVVIYVNTRRSARRIEEILCESGARLLPDIRVVTDLASDPSAPFAKAIPSLRRRLIIARLVAVYIEQQPDVAPRSAVFDLADSLGDLLDSFQGEGIAIEALKDIEVGAQSQHWERSKRFLEILGDYWQNHRPENAPDGEERQRQVAEHYAKLWSENPPQHPVIVAGSTGSRGATAIFMQAVANLPQGAIVLPGFDFEMPRESWENAGLDHPQFGFRNLAQKMGVALEIPLWHECAPANIARNRLLSLAMRPAPVTDQWLSDGPKLTGELPLSCDNITLIEAPSPRAEAEAIAIRLRMAAQNGQKAALVSPDRMLTRRVTSVLQRWGIAPDDSAGRPLPLTPPGIFLRRLIALAGIPLTPQNLLAMLKHPLCGGDDMRSDHLQMTRKLEMEHLRGGPPFINWPELHEWAAKGEAPLGDWLEWLHKALLPVLEAPVDQPLTDWLDLHRAVADRLSAGINCEPSPLWKKEAGVAAISAFETLMLEAKFGGIIALDQYRALFQSILNSQEVHEEAYLPHPGIAILGTLEARVQSADLVILGGMNEGIWPSTPKPDPWMSRDMRRQIGLPLPERQTGLSAHDFQQAIAAQEVVISRSIRDGEAPTVASRWVIRLLNLLDGLDASQSKNMRARGAKLLALAEAMNRPERVIPPAKRPAPSPPVNARPDRLSVTRIEVLVRDPYSIYADKVLKLRALDPPGKEADARERGNALHNVMEEFLHQTLDGLPDNAETVFLEVARRVLGDEVPWPSTRRLWLARLKKIATWFIDGEHRRRDLAKPLAQECKGERVMRSIKTGFTLSAKADRIDLLANGSLAIYDYKSGGLPSVKQIENFAMQLPLEGAIAQDGGFEGIAKAKISYLGLIGLGSGGKERAVDKDDADIAEVWQRLEALIEKFTERDLGYLARSRPELISYASDFDHLSRYGEWQDGDDFVVEEVE